jgi:hypothetical protein
MPLVASGFPAAALFFPGDPARVMSAVHLS